jgi:beta-glucanase (GH16 family)
MMGDAISWDGWPACGEIDIMETMNSEERCFGRLHWTDRNGRYTKSESFEDIDIASFHSYSVEWTPSMIRWFVDDIQYHSIGELSSSPSLPPHSTS